MKRNFSASLQITLGVLFLWLLGCNAQIPTIQTSTPTKTAVPTSSPTLAPPTATATKEFTILSTSIQQSGKWGLKLPYSDQNAPELISYTQEGYQLDATLNVESIDLTYESSGPGDPKLIYEQIKRHGSAFQRENISIATTSIKKLLQSISHLYPQPQMLLNIYPANNEYPVWAIEITNTDGHHILLYSNSNGPNYAPWNIMYNGKIYTQLDGQISKGLSGLFKITTNRPMMQLPMQEFPISVTAIGLPEQLLDGFSGLLPIQSTFTYSTNAQTGELKGYILGRAAVGGMWAQYLHTITSLEKIILQDGNNSTIVCSIKAVELDDRSSYAWDFTCPIGVQAARGTYNYPIEVTFGTIDKKNYTTTGDLFGSWEPGTRLSPIPYPDEIGKILERDPAIQDLTTDHQLEFVKFDAMIDPLTGSMSQQWSSDVTFLGQAKIENRILPYTITTRIRIKDNEISHWDLNRSKLKALLQDVLNQPITNHFLDQDPNLTLNLYYLEGDEDTYSAIGIRSTKTACGNLPTTEYGLPNKDQALRGFSFNQPWAFSPWAFSANMQIVIIENKLRIVRLKIQPSLPKDAVWVSLLPAELQPKQVPPFQRINAVGSSPSIILSWGTHASRADIDIYKEFAKSWPEEKVIWNWGITIEQSMLGITPDGHLALIDCGKK